MEERLQKILARAGYGSRRANEDLITAGRVSVNGKTASLGDKADPHQDRITVDGKPIRLPEELVYIAIYKPRGVISSVSAPDPRSTVVDLVDLPEKIYPVGRLDVDSEGLMLLTNDGQLTNELTHPRYGHEKEYRVLVARRPDEEQISAWRRGVVLEDGYRTQPADVRVEQPFGKGAWLRVIMREGRKRQIRETGFKLGLPVVRIIRIRIGSLQLGALKPKEWRRLNPQEVLALRDPKATQPQGKGGVRRERQGTGGRLSGGGHGARSGPAKRDTPTGRSAPAGSAQKKKPVRGAEMENASPRPPTRTPWKKDRSPEQRGKPGAGSRQGTRGEARTSRDRPGSPGQPSRPQRSSDATRQREPKKPGKK